MFFILNIYLYKYEILNFINNFITKGSFTCIPAT